jgi:xylulose-5-phosphate/fructose-6-phosphate phosphoketolase
MSEAAGPLRPEELERLDRWWRAANYLSVAEIFLMANALLREPLRAEHVKPRLLGHWGTTPGLNLVYTHLNRVVRERDLDMLLVCGPGHGGPALLAQTWLEGSYSERYPHVPRDGTGLERLCREFSFPGGSPSHAGANVPGSINEGGELGYALLHATGAAFDHPGLVVACVVGDGEAETGALAASWHGNKFLDPRRDGAVLPILHLNGWKIANPTVLARIPEDELRALLEGCGWAPTVVRGEDPVAVHQALAAALDAALDEIAAIQRAARAAPPDVPVGRPRWPMLVLETPKGWTGPKVVDGLPVEGTWRAHQVPLPAARDDPVQLAQLEAWLRSYRPEELFDADGRPAAGLEGVAPAGDRRLGANPKANGGLVVEDLELPDYRRYGVALERPGGQRASATSVLGGWLRDVVAANPGRFRVFGPDETVSNRLGAVLEATDRVFEGERRLGDDHLGAHGQVVEVLSEHCCQGWLEGYLLTGRHGIFNCYEAFIHIVDSMFNQHAKWLKVTREIPWRAPLPSLTYLLSSHVWRQDHNGFSHQDPGFLDHVVNKKAEVVRVYLPPDANCLLSVIDHCLRSRHYVNVVVAGKNREPVWFTPEEAAAHCARGIGVVPFASCEDGSLPDVVLGCAGDVPMLETLAAAEILRRELPELRVRVVNVVDLMRLQPPSEHPHGLPDAEYDALFPPGVPTIFAFHGYPWLVHRLAYRRAHHDRLHVRGYKEEGTTTTPFDMVMLNDLDRFHLVMDVVDRVGGLGARAARLRQEMADRRYAARAYTREHGRDDPEISEWSWGA